MSGFNNEEEAMKERAKSYHEAPKATSRLPEPLYNRNCGAVYKSCGKLTKKGIRMLVDLLQTETFVMFTVLCTIYHNRNNTIENASALSRGAIQGIFSCGLLDYRFSVNEIYKRYCMRKGHLGSSDQSHFNFWKLSKFELRDFTEWLDELGFTAITGKGGNFLWHCDQGLDDKYYLKFDDSPFTLAVVQAINSFHDIIKAWNDTDDFQEWNRKQKSSRRYMPSYAELENINVYKQRQKQKEMDERFLARYEALKAQREAELKEQAAIQRQVLAPLPPVASRIRDDMPAVCYRYDGGRIETDDEEEESDDSDDSDDYNYRAKGITRGGPAGAGRYNDKSNDDDEHLSKGIKKDRPLADARMYSSTYTARDNDDDRHLNEEMTKERSPADNMKYLFTKPVIYTDKCDDDGRHGAKGVTGREPPDIKTYEASADSNYGLIISVKRKTGNRTADLFLHDAYYKLFVAKTKADENKFLNEYLVKIVRADSVHCWACEQIKSQVFTSADLMHQIRNIFDEDDEALTRDDNARYSWRDYRKYSEKMAYIFERIVDSKCKAWQLYTNEKLLWFYFRSWFVNHRMAHCLVYRARLVITCHKFDREKQTHTETPRYDTLYSLDQTRRSLKTLEAMQTKAIASRRYGSTASDDDRYGYRCKGKTRRGPADTRMKSSTYNDECKRTDDDTHDYGIKAKTRGGSSTAGYNNDEKYRSGTKGLTRGPSTAGNDNNNNNIDNDDEYGAKGVTRGGPLTAVDNKDNDDEHGYSHESKGITKEGPADTPTHSTKSKDSTADTRGHGAKGSNYNETAVAATTSTAGYDDKKAAQKAQDKAKAKDAYGDNDSDSNDVENEEETISHVDMDLCSVATSFVNVENER